MAKSVTGLPDCPVTGKVSLPSKKIPDAHRAIHAGNIKRKKGKRAVYLRSYRCTKCPYWHLSHHA